MSRIFFFILVLFSPFISNGQTAAVLKNIIQDKSQAAANQQEISNMTNLLANMFLTKANNKKEKLHTQVQDFFAEYKMHGENLKQYNYPAVLTKSNLAISATGFDYNWGLSPKEGDTSLAEGYRNKVFHAIVTIPVFDSYHQGYSMNTIAFYCTLKESVTWTEPRNYSGSIEKLPGYKKEEQVIIKLLDPEK